METIKQVLMRRDGMSSSEADILINEAVTDLNERIASDDCSLDVDSEICADYFSLEPDYFIELLGIAENISK